jgi:hypothetical protein
MNYTLMKIRHLADEIVSFPRTVEIAQGVGERSGASWTGRFINDDHWTSFALEVGHAHCGPAARLCAEYPTAETHRAPAR